MLKAIRIALAAFFFTGITWLFLDVTETAQHLVGWMARIQFLPAVLALSIGIVALLILLTAASTVQLSARWESFRILRPGWAHAGRKTAFISARPEPLCVMAH